MRQAPVLIVSAFGRGQSLAAALKQSEIPVELVDLSTALGASAPEDEEGPFGVNLSMISGVDLERIHQDDALLSQEAGWTFVLKDGPIEMKGPTVKHRLTQLGLDENVSPFFRDLRSPVTSFDFSSWSKKSFTERWLVDLSWQLALNRYLPLSGGIQPQSLLDFDGEFGLRNVSRMGLEKSLDWLARRGVSVHRDLSILDLARESGQVLKSLEVRSESSKTSELFAFEQLVWCLTSQETAFLGSVLAEKLFPRGVLIPKFFWARFRLRMSDSIERRILPHHSVWIKDLDLPWTHENLIILQKSGGEDIFDAWVRIPHDQRMQKAYLQERMDGILENLNERFVYGGFVKAEDPLATDRTSFESGPVRFPIFDSSEFGNWRPGRDLNVIYHSAEVWDGLGWSFLFKYETKIINRLALWWKKREEVRMKKESREKKDD